MSKSILIFGHGEGDPGATGIGGSERKRLEYLASRIRLLLGKNKEVELITDINVYKRKYLNTHSKRFKGKTVIDLHFNAFDKKARGSEILLPAGYRPNRTDEILRAGLSHFKWRGYKSRDNLYNLNVARQYGMDYRLVEICFCDNAEDIAIYEDNIEEIALAIIRGALKDANFKGPSSPAPTSPPSRPDKKSDEEIVREVIAGEWGNGADRAARLKAAGYDSKVIQSAVNRQLGVNGGPSVAAIAKQVIAGDWGNNPERAKRLKDAGYDPKKVQAEVNRQLK